MLNLRPKLAREFAEAIYDDLVKHHHFSRDEDDRETTLQEWTELIVERFVSHSIPVRSVATYDPEAAWKFVEKYPALERLIDLCKEEALRRWPEATFRLELHSDPEGCHTCYEGQSITLEIQTGLAFYGPNGEEYPENSPYHAADEAWSDWMFEDDSPYSRLEKEIGDVAHLFRPDLTWKREPEDEE